MTTSQVELNPSRPASGDDDDASPVPEARQPATPAPRDASVAEAATGLDPSLRRALQLIGSVIAPTTLITALLFYFGWVRTAAQAKRLGLDPTILGYSAQDYVLRSIRSMFVPLAIGLVLVILGLWAHSSIMRRISHDRAETAPAGASRPLRMVAWSTVVLGLAVFGVGLYDQLVPDIATNLLAPLCFSSGIVLVSYATYLLRGPLAGAGSSMRAREPLWMGAARAMIVGLLLALSLFWSVSDYASDVGRQLGDRIVYGQAGLPRVVLYSPRRLYLQFDGVNETKLDETEGAYRFRYQGLEFLERTGGRYFLRPIASPTTGLVTIVIPESDAPQLQFVR